MSNGCCGVSPKVWIGGNWVCSECDSIMSSNEQLSLIDWQGLGGAYKTDKPKVCDCGADKCKTTHANWCSKKD